MKKSKFFYIIMSYLVVTPLSLAYYFSHQPARPEGLVKVEADHFVVFAPTEQQARNAAHSLRRGISIFERLLGNSPRKIATLLQDSTSFNPDVVAYVQRQGTTFLPGLSSFASENIHSSEFEPSSVLPIGRAVLKQDGFRIVVASIVPGDRSTRFRSADVLRSVNGDPVEDIVALKSTYAALRLGDVLTLSIERDSQLISIQHTKPRTPSAAQQQITREFIRSMARTRPLAHEACHASLSDLVKQSPYRNGERSSSKDEGNETNQYGTKLPDWFDEMVATQCEPLPMRANRHTNLRRYFDRRLALEDLFSMQYPLQKRILALADKLASQMDQAYVVKLRGATVDSIQARSGIRSLLFYAQSMSVGEYLMHRSDSRTVHTLMENLLQGQTMSEALQSIDTLPASVQVLEAEWEAWVKDR